MFRCSQTCHSYLYEILNVCADFRQHRTRAIRSPCLLTLDRHRTMHAKKGAEEEDENERGSSKYEVYHSIALSTTSRNLLRRVLSSKRVCLGDEEEEQTRMATLSFAPAFCACSTNISALTRASLRHFDASSRHFDASSRLAHAFFQHPFPRSRRFLSGAH